ncbi:MAG: Stk1 family PASTA domain-containing Ser/Thr kinase [Oscillospiraceae bacterium]|nr:Stk1 family PASTA domain-containing Ser/Thr kinase [Oscillospiraceae bacterium]
MDKNIGKKLDGRYEITELIGIGGMADVYKAVDLVENRTVAVKILKNEFADNDDFVRRFRNESKAIAVLSHPNIVRIYDVGFSDRIQFIVMEYIDGITLKEFMEQQGVLKWKDSVHFIIQILRALQHAHDRGIVHRDIKPQNIMLFPDGTIKVMDFGIARFAREEGKTISDKAIGSVHYISPEQARGDITDEKSDIYSVGVMLYEMLTGVKPFDADTPIAVALMHMQNNPKPPRAINNTIPEGLESIVMRAMQRDASKRYQSASEMIKDIEEFKQNPSIVFEYNYLDTSSGDTEKTQYFRRPEASGGENGNAAPAHRFKEDTPKKAHKDEVRKTKPKKSKEEVYENEDIDDYDDDDEDDGEVSKSSYFVVALTAIAAAVVIIAMVFITVVIMNTFLDDKKTEPMVNLVGHEYQYCKTYYSEYFTLVVGEERYDSEIPKGYIISHTPKEGAPIVRGSTEVKAVVSKGPQMVTVPNVYSLPADTAESMINGSKLKVSIVMQNSDAEKNTVIKTEPERNTEVQIDSTVIMYVSLGPEIYDVIMPNLVGENKDTAKSRLESQGFTVQLQEEDSAEPADTVIAQSIPALDAEGKSNIVSPNQTVVLTYSSGKAPRQAVNITFAVPDGLKGKAVFNAYVGGNMAGTISVDNIGYVSTISIPVEGSDTQKTVVEVADDKGNTEILGEYNVDFNTMTVSEVRFDKNVLITLFGVPEPTETQAPSEPSQPGEQVTGFHDPGSDVDIIDNNDYEDWWNSIINSY